MQIVKNLAELVKVKTQKNIMMKVVTLSNILMKKLV